MKIIPSVNPICQDCRVVRREGRLMVIHRGEGHADGSRDADS